MRSVAGVAVGVLAAGAMAAASTMIGIALDPQSGGSRAAAEVVLFFGLFGAGYVGVAVSTRIDRVTDRYTQSIATLVGVSLVVGGAILAISAPTVVAMLETGNVSIALLRPLLYLGLGLYAVHKIERDEAILKWQEERLASSSHDSVLTVGARHDDGR